MKKRLILLLSIAAAVVLAFAFGKATKAEASELKSVTTRTATGLGEVTTETHDYRPVSDLSQLQATDYVFLTGDLTLTAQFLPAENQVLYLDLNGHTLTGAAGSRAIHYNGAKNAKIVLSNGTLDLTGTAKGMWGPGAYLNAEGEVLILDNVTITNGEVTNGNGFGGCVTLSNTSAELHCFDSTFTNLKGNGGPAISVNAGSAYFHSGAITKCSTTSRGGACFVNDLGKLYLLGGKIGGSEEDKCTSVNQGGAILVRANGYVLVDGAEISYNEQGFGGQICAQEGATLEMKSGLITKGKATTNNYGGNISLFQASKFLMSGGTVSDGSVVLQNNSTYGGNIAIRDGGTVEISGGTISGGFGADHGGNISAVSVDGVIRISEAEGKTTLITNGTANRYGGNIQSVGKIYISGGTITNGVAGTNGGNIAVTAENAVLEITGGKITNGKAHDFGGNITVNNAGTTVTFADVEISGGESTHDCGGNVNFQAKCNVTISGTTKITGGKAYKHSGNCRFNNSTVTMTGGEISGGISGSGGAVEGVSTHGGNCTFSGPVTMSGNAKIIGGTSPTHSGNIYVEGANASLTMSGNALLSGGQSGTYGVNTVMNLTMSEDAKIEGGVAATYGGALYLLDGTLTMSGNAMIVGGSTGELVYNDKGTVIAGYGGAVKTAYPVIMSGNACITGGEAKAYGGNLVLEGLATLTMSENASITNGKAGTNGGNITVTGKGSITMSDNARIENGTADWGGNIALNNGGTFTMNDGYVLNGKAKSTSGNISTSGTASSVIIKDGQVTGGTILNGEEEVAMDIILGENATAEISGGWIGKIAEAKANSHAGFITGGHFIECPDPQFAGVEGKTFIQGKDESKKHNNPDTTDTNDYYFQLEDVSNGILIDADSVVTGLSGLVLNIEGTGYYNNGAAFTLTAPEDDRFTFLGWFEGETKLTEEYTFAGTATAAKVYTAKYSYTDSEGNVLILTINVPFKYSYKVGSAAAKSAIGQTTVAVERGEAVTLKYTDTKEFFAWMNASKKILADTATYTFNVFTNTEILGEEALPIEEEKSFALLFLNDADQVLGYVSYPIPVGEDPDDFYAEFPALPNRLGRTTRWDFDEYLEENADDDIEIFLDNVNTGVFTADLIRVHLVVEDTTDEYTITVNGCDEAVTVTKPIGDPAWIELPEENAAGKKLVAVKDGEVVITNASSFSYKATGDKTLTAVYADEEGTKENLVVMTLADRDGSTVYFTACRSIVSGVIAEQGIIFAKSNLGDELKKGASGVYASIGKTTNLRDSYTMNLNGVPTSAKVYARGYVILTDGTEIYSDIAAVE